MGISGQRPRTSVDRRRRGSIASLIGIAALGLVVALAAAVFAITRTEPALASMQPAGQGGGPARLASITYREPALGGGLISPNLALQSARLFSENPDLALAGGLEQGGLGSQSYAIYYFEIGDGRLSYRIDARTAEVLEMSRLDALPPTGRPARLDPLAAEQAAERFAADHFLGFKGLTLVERNATSGDGSSPLYTFKWTMLAPESGAELPTAVSVSLSAASGDVVWYLAQRESTTLDVRPQITREAAVSTAAALAERAERWDTTTPSSVRLQVIFNQDNEQLLVWAVTFPSRSGDSVAGRPSLRILVDGRTGEPVSNPA